MAERSVTPSEESRSCTLDRRFLDGMTVREMLEHLSLFPFLTDITVERLLGPIELFRGLSTADLDEIAKEAVLRVKAPGETVCRQGEYGQTFYVVIDGKVSVEIRTEEGTTLAIDTIGPGNFFGEISALSFGPRAASVTAVSETLVLEISNTQLIKLMDAYPHAKELVDRRYVERSLNSHLRKIKLFSVLTEEELYNLIRKAELCTYREGEVIFGEGDEGDCFYLVRNGFVKASKHVDDQEIVVTYLRENSSFGETSLLTGEKRAATVTAMTRVDLVRVGMEAFQQVVSGNPSLKAHLEEVMRERQGMLQKAGEDVQYHEALEILGTTGTITGRRIIAIDLTRCLHCDNCALSCEMVNGVSLLNRRGPRVANLMIPTACRQCYDPVCMYACKFHNITRDLYGEIHHGNRCTGCGKCAEACHYGHITMVEVKGSGSPDAGPRLKAMMCDMCQDRSHVVCVHNCPSGAAKIIDPGVEFTVTVPSS